MSSVQATVADCYQYVVGVDTHAATHSYAVIPAPAGALIDQAAFPTTAAGLRRAREWIARRTGGELDRVLIAAEGTGSYGAVLADSLGDSGYRIIEAPTPRRERGRGKTDSLDAVRAARSCLVQPLAMLCDRRAGEVQVALQVLTAARDQLNADRLRCLNALTALVRSHDLGIDARRALTGRRSLRSPVGAAATNPWEPRPPALSPPVLPRKSSHSTRNWPTTAASSAIWSASKHRNFLPCPALGRSPLQ